jgi:3-phenylpropionate/trans-cinnamate dioxygenase ferredoxin subunit
MNERATDTAGRRDVLADVEQAIAALEGHDDAAVRDAVSMLLAGIDAVHRTGLTHLVTAIRGLSGDTLINRVIADPAVRLLLMSYDLVPVDRRLQAEEALDTVRGHLHDHGIDVEILDVVGGVVYARVHVTPMAGATAPDEPRVRADLEAALREYLIGFQELELGARPPQLTPSAVVPLSALKSAMRPVYRDALAAGDVPEGTMHAAVVGETPVLFARVGGEVYALHNQCGDSPLPLDTGTLEGAEVRCTWHGCRYDVRSGRRLDRDGRVQVLPTRTENGRILVAIGVAPAAQ